MGTSERGWAGCFGHYSRTSGSELGLLAYHTETLTIVGAIVVALAGLSELALFIWWYVHARVFEFLAAMKSKATDCVCEFASTNLKPLNTRETFMLSLFCHVIVDY